MGSKSKPNKNAFLSYPHFSQRFQCHRVFQRPADTAFSRDSGKCVQERFADGHLTQRTKCNPGLRKTDPLVAGSWRAVPGDTGLADYLDFLLLASASASGYSGDWMVAWRDLCSDPV